MANPLKDREFLKQLHLNRTRYTLARIISLDENDVPVETIEGRVTGGSANVDGASAVRRTCSLTLVADPNLRITDFYWALKSKFKLEIGLKNTINPNYPDIIWFKQGIFLISSFNKQLTTNNLTISIQGKDKMARLNGEMGGAIPAQTRFDVMDEIDVYGNITEVKIPIKQIITSALILQGYENPHNIFINDLDEYGYELWDYRAKNSKGESFPMYYFYSNKETVANITTNGDMEIGGTALRNIPEQSLYNRIDGFDESIPYGDDGYRIAKIQYGDTAGYHRTELIYPSELTLAPGEPITALLDKIKNLLGAFEYFYDVDGHFIFQKKKTYTEGLFSPLREDGSAEPAAALSEYIYKFEDAELITNLSVNPQINNIKNDFSIQGNRKSASGADIPIHARYAVDTKPEKYTTLDYYVGYHMCYLDTIQAPEDTKELIYERRTNGTGYDYVLKEDQRNKTGGWIIKEDSAPDQDNSIFYKDGNNYIKLSESTTIYERNKTTKKFEVSNIQAGQSIDLKKTYFILWLENESRSYTTTQVDWRELIYLMARDYYQHNEEADFQIMIRNNNSQFPTGKTGYEQYYTDMQGFWRQLYNPKGTRAEGFLVNGSKDENGETFEYKGNYPYWHVNAVYYPEQLNFWIDFLEPNSPYLQKYSIAEIGDRIVVDNKSNVKTLQLKEKPEVESIIMPEEAELVEDKGSLEALATMRIQPEFSELFSISTRGTTAAEKADELINKHICENETIGITIIPLYFLEPNTKIYVKNEELGIDSDFILTKFTIPLTYNGTMSLTTTKVLKYIK